MAKKFITTRELNLIDQWNSELIQGVSKQEIIYYAISEETAVHPVYDEALNGTKVFLDPVRVAARCRFRQGPTRSRGGNLDAQYELDVELHRKECEERNLRPREGDFVEYGQIFYEVTSVHSDQPVFGQVNDKLKVHLSCVPSREGLFQADADSEEGIDNSHPVEAARPRTLGDDL